MSPTYIKGVTENFPAAQITFDPCDRPRFGGRRRDTPAGEKLDPSLKGTRRVLLKDRKDLNRS